MCVLYACADGPVARAYNQSSVFGCGADWCADLLAQYCLAVWTSAVLPKSGITTFTVIFTVVEIATGLFDFAISATGVYPELVSASRGFVWTGLFAYL